MQAGMKKGLSLKAESIDLVGGGLAVITDCRSQSPLLLIYRHISGDASHALQHTPDVHSAAGL